MRVREIVQRLMEFDLELEVLVCYPGFDEPAQMDEVALIDDCDGPVIFAGAVGITAEDGRPVHLKVVR